MGKQKEGLKIDYRGEPMTKKCTYPEFRKFCFHGDIGGTCISSDKKDCIYKYFKDAKAQEKELKKETSDGRNQ